MKISRTLSIARNLAVTSLVVFSVLSAFQPLRGAESAAQAGGRYGLPAGTHEFGLWAGGSPDSSDLIGTTEDRQLAMAALRYGHVLYGSESLSLEYTVDVFPAAVVFEPSRARRGKSKIYGAGLSPLGFKMNFGQQSWIKPFIAASVGFLYFEDDVPVPRSSRFNFTPEIGLGVQFFLAPKSALTLGYKLHHMSNAYTSRNNPGMDSHVIYAGFSFFTP
jgi:hypothetical protein